MTRDACDPWLDRIVTIAADGGRPTDDDAVAAHVRTCLSCFRATATLRELPLVEAALREDSGAEDPGEAFWRRFPGQVTDAWVATRAPTRGRVRGSLSAFGAWLRRPLPAACLAASVTAAVAITLGTAAHAPRTRAAATDFVDDALSDPELDDGHRGLSAAETIEQLDDAELARLAAAWGAGDEGRGLD